MRPDAEIRQFLVAIRLVFPGQFFYGPSVAGGLNVLSLQWHLVMEATNRWRF